MLLSRFWPTSRQVGATLLPNRCKYLFEIAERKSELRRSSERFQMSMMLPAFAQAEPNITDHRPSVFLIAVSLLVLQGKLSTVTPATKNIQRVYRNRAQKHIRLMRLGADAGALMCPLGAALGWKLDLGSTKKLSALQATILGKVASHRGEARCEAQQR